MLHCLNLGSNWNINWRFKSIHNDYFQFWWGTKRPMSTKSLQSGVITEGHRAISINIINISVVNI